MPQVAKLERELEELSGREPLDRVDVLHAQQQRTDLLILQAACQNAAVNNEETTDLVPAPWARNALFAAGLLMGDALDLRHRLPRLWGRVRALEVKVSYARYVAKKTRQALLGTRSVRR